MFCGGRTGTDGEVALGADEDRVGRTGTDAMVLHDVLVEFEEGRPDEKVQPVWDE